MHAKLEKDFDIMRLNTTVKQMKTIIKKGGMTTRKKFKECLHPDEHKKVIQLSSGSESEDE